VIRTILCFGVSLFSAFSMKAQNTEPLCDTLNMYCFAYYAMLDSKIFKQLPFIVLEKNNFQFFSVRSPNWEHLHKEFNSMIQNKDRKLNFYHLGGSHIQADIYSNDFRAFLQTHWSDLPGERGIVFPFDLAKTNNPANYEFSSPNNWSSYKSVGQRPETIDYGVMGAALICRDSVINIYFKHDRTNVKPAFSKLRIYHNKGTLPFELNFGADEILVYDLVHNEEKGYTDIYFTDPIDQLDVQFSRITREVLELEIYGVQFMN